MNFEIICTVCFMNKPKYLRSCCCLYCEDCKNSISGGCPCGGSGSLNLINSQLMEDLKHVALETKEFYRKLMDTVIDKIVSQFQAYSNYFQEVLDIRVHHEKQFQRHLVNKIKNLEAEVDSLKKRGISQSSFEGKENPGISSFEHIKLNTPKLSKYSTNTGSATKKPFCHDNFHLFFNKK